MDKKKIELLYKANYRRLFMIARGILGNDEESRDAVNEAFSNLLSAETVVDDGEEPRFLAACVRNVCLNVIKHKNIHERFAEMCFAAAKTDNGGEDYWRDTADEVMQVVNSLFNERMRRVFNLRFVEGLKYDEIAEKLGVARMTVYKDLFRGIDLVKEKVQR